MGKSNESGPALSVFDVQTIIAETRVNVVRVAGITVFYLIHFVRVVAPQLGELFPSLELKLGSPVPIQVHVCVSVLCLGWLLQSLVVYLKTSQGSVSPWLGVYTTLGDLGWLTALLCLSTGPASPMVAGYFLILMLAGIRFDLRLIRIATGAAGLCYLFLIGATRWPFGLLKEVPLESVSRFHQLMTLVSIILSGVIVGQIVRQAYLIGEKTVDKLQQSIDSTETKIESDNLNPDDGEPKQPEKGEGES